MTRLPAGWTKAKIGQICNLINGKAFKPSDWVDKGLPIVRIQNLNNPEAPFNYYEGDISDRFVIHNGQLLFAWSGTPGTSFGAHIWSGQTAVLNQHIFKVQFDEDESDKKFLRLAIDNKLSELIEIAHGGVGLRHVTKGMFEDTCIPLPPLNEQRRIVAKLDSLLGKSKRAREELAKIPSLIQRYKQAVLEAALQGKKLLTSSSKTWKKVTVNDVAEAVFDGPFGSHLKSSDYVSEGIRVVRLENIGHLKFIADKEAFISLEKFQRLKRHTLLSNDILFSSFVDESVRVCLLPGDIGGQAINKADCFCVRVDSNVCTPEYLTYRLAAESTYKIFVQSVHGATRPRINLSILKSFSFSLPSLEDQALIAQHLSEQFTRLDILAAETIRAGYQLDRFDQATLSKAFRGELAPQDPNDEPASVLLERLRRDSDVDKMSKRGRRAKA
jgi:type I restriction enzyme S subunit